MGGLDCFRHPETLGVQHHAGRKGAQDSLITDIAQLHLLDAIHGTVGRDNLKGRTRGDAAEPLTGNNCFRHRTSLFHAQADARPRAKFCHSHGGVTCDRPGLEQERRRRLNQVAVIIAHAVGAGVGRGNLQPMVRWLHEGGEGVYLCARGQP